MPSAEFTNSIVTGLVYWRERTRDMDDRVIAEVDGQRQNLFRAVHFGLDLPAAWPAVANVALQMVPLVNRRMYRAEWIPVLEQLLARCPVEDRTLKFDLLIQLGRMQRLERQLEQASRTHQAAKTLARELGDKGALAQAYYNLSRDYLDKRQYEESERYSLAALEIFDDLEDADQTIVAWALDTLGRINRARGDYRTAGEYLIRAMDIRRAIGDPTGIARALNELANNSKFSGQLDEAISYYQEADQHLTSTANELDKATIRMNLGSTYFDKEDWTLAEKSLRRAYSPYLRQSGNLLLQASAVVSLGNVLLKQERLVEAEAYLRLAIDLWRKVDDDLNLANAIGSLGEVLVLQGEAAEAILLFEEALVLLERYPEHPWTEGLQDLFETERKKAVDLFNEGRPGG